MDININIQTTQFNELGEKNIIKTNSDGTLYQKKDHKYIIYKQVEDGEQPFCTKALMEFIRHRIW